MRGAPAILERLGYPRPVEDKVVVHLKYSNQLLRMPPDALREIGLDVSPMPARPTRIALARCEHGTWVLDGKRLGAAQRLAWAPWPGRHELALLARDGSTVQTVRFEVRGAGMKPK